MAWSNLVVHVFLNVPEGKINFAKRSFSLDFAHVDMLKFLSSCDLI